MVKKLSKSNIFIVVSIVSIMLSAGFLPVALAVNVDRIKGFDKGPSYTAVVPLKKATMVNFDEDSLIDDYAYLAAIPTAVFQDKGRLFSHPLLFYQDEYPVEEDRERSLNARQGLDYFMEDWMSYCNGRLDQMTLINVPKNKLDSSWRARDYVMIDEDNPYDLAGEIALSDWSYSDNAVIAVIEEEYEKPDEFTKGEVSSSLSAYDVGRQHFEVELPTIGTGGTYKSFTLTDEHYKYLIMEISWSNNIDYDLQIYDTELGMVDNAARDYKDHNRKGLNEVVGSYIHNHGKWKLSVTAVPKKGIWQGAEQEQNGLFSGMSFKELAKALKNKGDVDIRLYPGTAIKIPETPFGCRDVDLTLEWDNPNIRLGFTVLDPVGTEICSSLSKEEITSGEVVGNEEGEVSVHVDLLGECRDGENYSICVFSLDDVIAPVDFKLEYSWRQNFSKIEGDGFASASNGAVIASKLNAPLLYTSSTGLPKATKDVLYKLGVENIYVVNIGSHLEEKIKKELKEIADITVYKKPQEVYDFIKDDTEKNDIIFTTIDPWTYWYVNERKPAGEYPGALFVGPAAYIAAHHKSPVIIVDLHPRLSQAIAYHTDFWKRPSNKQHVDEPCSGSMVLSSRQVYDFLEDYDLGKLEEGGPAEQLQETIITVAGQYEIGTSWDRAFTGAALPGRFMFSPVDTAYWISRNVFYPALIFENPALQGEITLINGSSSRVQRIGGRLKEPRGVNLVITKPSGEEEFEYPVLQTYVSYQYKFNEKASKHWDFKYTRADGIIPYETDSLDPIDDGVVPGKSGAYYPDQSETEVIPFYCKRAGYDSVFSTSFDAVVEDLNRGVIIWVENCHGFHKDGGLIGLWDSDSPYIYEENPWRAYEIPILHPGNIRELLRFASYLLLDMKIPIPYLTKFHLLSEIGSTENPDVTCINPQLTLINKFLTNIGFPVDFWGALGVMIYRDRIKHPLKALSEGLPLVNIYNGDGKVVISPRSGGVHVQDGRNGIDFDDALENLHSCGLNTISCLPACTYLHLTWMRHGMTYQIIDPWTTTDWAAVWTQMLIKRFAMGDTVGEAYERGIRACGPEFAVGHWWWDRWENVELFGDPDLRVFVPGTDYSDENYWEQEDTKPLRYDEDISINGHMPFGAAGYPHEVTPSTFLEEYMYIIIIIVVALVILLAVAISIKKRK